MEGTGISKGLSRIASISKGLSRIAGISKGLSRIARISKGLRRIARIGNGHLYLKEENLFQDEQHFTISFYNFMHMYATLFLQE